MHQVITAEQAKQITGGRDPKNSFTIVEYKLAVSLLRECLALDDAKRFANFADAKAAWAEIVHNDEALRLARALKIEAGRRMGLLAAQLRPGRRGGAAGGRAPGPRSLLVESGLRESEADGAIRASRLSEEEFKEILKAEEIPALSSLGRARGDWTEVGSVLSVTWGMMNRVSPEEATKRLSASHRPKAVVNTREKVKEISEWCDAFLARLPPTK